jgi:predicted ATPase
VRASLRLPSRLHILTGAPGTGKTAILDVLRAGYPCIAEPAREILAEQRSIGGEGVPDRNASRFVDLLLQRSIEKHAEARSLGGVVLFDRGVPDCVAYAERLGANPAPSVRAASEYRYHRTVLVARPWAEIYTTDEERKMPYEATLDFQDAIESAYARAGYTLVEIPRGSIQARITFVKEHLTP